MAVPSASISFPSTSADTFRQHLRTSNRILVLVGAGLSAASGLATYRGVGSDGLWRGKHNPQKLASLDAFENDPVLVWDLFAHRLKQANDASPNAGHAALAGFAKARGKDEVLVLSMNVDGLCSRAGTPSDQLLNLHGSLSELKCSSDGCKYEARPDYSRHTFLDYILTPSSEPEPSITKDTLPHCPQCHGLLRPGVVLFGESLPKAATDVADAYIRDSHSGLDLMLVVGTLATVWPASSYVDEAVEKGARVAMVNIDRGNLIPEGAELSLSERDWFFVGDAAELLPRLLAPFDA